MAFNKKGSPESTVAVVKQDGTVASFCEACKSMSDSAMDKKAFVSGQTDKCAKCGRPS